MAARAGRERQWRCRMVTAGPGSGKTAVLGLIAALSHPEHRLTVPARSFGLSERLMPDAGSVDVAIPPTGLGDPREHGQAGPRAEAALVRSAQAAAMRVPPPPAAHQTRRARGLSTAALACLSHSGHGGVQNVSCTATNPW